MPHCPEVISHEAMALKPRKAGREVHHVALAIGKHLFSTYRSEMPVRLGLTESSPASQDAGHPDGNL